MRRDLDVWAQIWAWLEIRIEFGQTDPVGAPMGSEFEARFQFATCSDLNERAWRRRRKQWSPAEAEAEAEAP